MAATAKRLLTLRVAERDLEQITRLATEHNLTRTDYIVRTALGTLDTVGTEQRLANVEQRLQRVEALAYA